MTPTYTRADDGRTFTFTTDNDTPPKTYSNDKDGKRQAILDGLQAIACIIANEDTYLPHDAAMQVVAAIMQPDGIPTKEAYQTICDVTARACAHLGYGDEVELAPPLVSFAQRGSYRKQYPPLKKEAVLDVLDTASISREQPQKEIMAEMVRNQMAWKIYDRSLTGVGTAERALIEQQTNSIIEEAGWRKQMRGRTLYYIQSLAPDMADAQAAIAAEIAEAEGMPISYLLLTRRLNIAAYGRHFYKAELAPALEACLQAQLTAAGYATKAVDGRYDPLPITLPADADKQLQQLLQTLPLHQTKEGHVILFVELLQQMQAQFALPTLSAWQAEALVTEGTLAAVLRQNGYEPALHPMQPSVFVPALASNADAPFVIRKEVRIENDVTRMIRLAKGFSVYTPTVVLDTENSNIVYLQMVGYKQAVRANWAALAAKKTCWIKGESVYLDGMKEHVAIRASLPCGWVDHILVHKQASIREMNPEEPFFLLDDGQQPIPPLFYAMLNRCLSVPLLPAWTRYLWENGRLRKLITLMNDGNGQGFAAWRGLPEPEKWQAVVQDGLRSGQIRF